jgi:hypothetical protein
MTMRAQLRFTLPIALSLLVSLGSVFITAPANAAAPNSAVLSVFHAAGEDESAPVVDVYAGNMRIMNNLKVGQLQSVRITQGRYDVTVFLDGKIPGTDEPLLRRNGVDLRTNANITFAIHPDSSGVLTASTYLNGGLRNPDGRGRLTIRQIAQAPEVDIRISGVPAFANLPNQSEASMHFPVGAQAVAVMRSGSEEMLITPRMVPVNRPLNTILYVWGSTDGGLRLAIQRVPLKK